MGRVGSRSPSLFFALRRLSWIDRCTFRSSHVPFRDGSKDCLGLTSRHSQWPAAVAEDGRSRKYAVASNTAILVECRTSVDDPLLPVGPTPAQRPLPMSNGHFTPSRTSASLRPCGRSEGCKSGPPRKSAIREFERAFVQVCPPCPFCEAPSLHLREVSDSIAAA